MPNQEGVWIEAIGNQDGMLENPWLREEKVEKPRLTRKEKGGRKDTIRFAL